MSDMTDNNILGFFIAQYLAMNCVTSYGGVSAGIHT